MCTEKLVVSESNIEVVCEFFKLFPDGFYIRECCSGCLRVRSIGFDFAGVSRYVFQWVVPCVNSVIE